MKLTSDLVPDTRHHRLALMIEPAAVEVVLEQELVEVVEKVEKLILMEL